MLNLFYLLGPYPKPFLFIMSKNKVKAIDLLTFDTAHVVRGLANPISMAIDPVDQKLYFRNGTDIVRSRVDGTDIEVILKKANPVDMTIDWIRRRIFWTRLNKRKILVANLNGKDKRVIRLTQDNPRFIAVDPIAG